MSRSRTLIVAVCVLVVLSGCATHDKVWSLSLHGSVDTVEGEPVFDGMVQLGGNTGHTTVSDVRVVFVTGDNTTIESVPVGQLNTTDRIENLTVPLDRKPQFIRIVAGRIDAPEDAEYDVSGLKLTENGGYRPFYQETTTEKSTASTTTADVVSMEGQGSALGTSELSTIEFQDIGLING